MLKVGIVGLGWWGTELAEALQKLPQRAEIAACASRDPDDAASFAGRFGGQACEDFESVLALPGLDAIILATPHSQHAEQVSAAAATGHHVFVEKPFTLTAASGNAAARACADAGVVLAVGHNRRFSAGARTIKQMLDDNEFGTVLHVEANFSTNSAMDYVPEQWRAQRSEAPGGALLSLGLHMIDTMGWLLGPISRVACLAKHRALPVDIDDTTAALLDFECGVSGTLGTNFACPMTSAFRLQGTGGNLEARDDFTQLIWHAAGAGERPSERPAQANDTLVDEMDAFIDACETGTPFPVTPAEAIHNIAVMEAMMRSAANGGNFENVTA